jgi:NADPH:quinone reductase-like Zn-dependent oxidoreductase
MKAIQVRTVGGPEVLEVRDVPDPYVRWCGRGRRVTAAPMPI